MNLFWKGFSEKLFSESTGAQVADFLMTSVMILSVIAVILVFVVAFIAFMGYVIEKQQEA